VGGKRTQKVIDPVVKIHNGDGERLRIVATNVCLGLFEESSRQRKPVENRYVHELSVALSS
jgi:hypothetical protein